MQRIFLKYGTPVAEYDLARTDAGQEQPLGPTGLSHNSTSLSQMREIVDATAAEFIPRGNMQTQLSFGATIKYATMEDAQAAAITLPIEMPRSGYLHIIQEDSEGVQKVLTSGTALAVVDNVAVTQLGITLLLQFTIRTGTLTEPTP